MVTIELKMGTKASQDRLCSALFGKTRQAVLALFLGQPDQTFYLREVVRLTGLGQGAVQRELGRLAQAGILQRCQHGRQVFFQANGDCPIFKELQAIMTKTAGLVDVVRQALRPLEGQIHFAFVFGSVARSAQRESSDVDLCIIGDASFADVVSALAPAQAKLAREVNPTVYPMHEFSAKLAQEHHFVMSLMRNPKTFVIGDEHEFEGLAGKRLADSTSTKPSGNH